MVPNNDRKEKKNVLFRASTLRGEDPDEVLAEYSEITLEIWHGTFPASDPNADNEHPVSLVHEHRPPQSAHKLLSQL
jgi:hypothetical protein